MSRVRPSGFAGQARLVLLLLAPLLGGCATTGGSVAGSECKVFEPPRFAVRGRAAYDQDWIDSTIEGGIGACRWKRPAVRPASLDARPAPRPAIAPAKKRGLVRKIKDRIWPAVPSAPAAPPAVEITAPPAPPAPPPRRAIDELLHPMETH